jgi:hypothetical protein
MHRVTCWQDHRRLRPTDLGEFRRLEQPPEHEEVTTHFLRCLLKKAAVSWKTSLVSGALSSRK